MRKYLLSSCMAYGASTLISEQVPAKYNPVTLLSVGKKKKYIVSLQPLTEESGCK